ncbi:MAG: GNAT family acetyltransferase [Clostridiales bacterium]|nr:GNAT family acetyltransferase [Clostridiales bacterium]
MTECIAVNIQDMLMAIGEEAVITILSDFSCPLNKGVEKFVQKEAIDFARRKLSVTYLVLKKDKDNRSVLAGIFSLTHKAVIVGSDSMSKTTKRKLNRFASFNSESGKYNVSAFLIAQFGKNYGIDQSLSIRGSELMKLTMDVLEDAQYRIGGGIIYLDCEDVDKVLNFYQNEYNRFVLFGDRVSQVDGKRYLQMIKFF